MKKGKKLLVLSALLGITIGAGGIIEYHGAMQRLNSKEIMAYKSNATNVLDNVYTLNGQKILPIIYKNPDETVANDKILKDFKAKGLNIQGTLPKILTTGTKIATDKGTYEVVVFGDVNNDGVVDGFDSQEIQLHFLKDRLKGTYKIAGNVYNDNEDEIDGFDAQRIELFYLERESNLVLNPPQSDAEKEVVTKVEWASQPTKKTYNYGEAFNPAGGKIKVTRVSGQVQTIPVDSSMVSGYNPTKVGEQTVTITYGGKKVTFKVTVKEQEVVTNVTIKTQPTKLSYDYGQTIDLKGGTLTVTYKSGKTTTVNMANSMIVGSKTANKVGTQVVALSYEGKTLQFNISVKDVIDSISMKTNPTKLTYNVGEKIEVKGGVIEVKKKSGAVEPVNITESMLGEYKLDKEGKKTITVIYQGKTTTFEVTVQDNVTNMVIDTNPTKTIYNYGEEFDTTGGKIKVTRPSGETLIDITSDMISGYVANPKPDQITDGVSEQNVVVTYGGKTAIVKVKVNDVVSNIEIATNPTKLTYIVGDAIDVTGGTITVTYKSTTVKTIDITKEMISGYDSQKVEEQTITVTYKGQTTTFKVTVEEPEQEDYVKKFKITTNPRKLEYVIGEDIDTKGMVVKVIKVSGEEAEVDLANLTISTDINNPHVSNTKVSADTSVVTVSYKANNENGIMTTFDATFTITIVKPIENIKVTKGITTGHMYDTLNAVATVESGEGELDITVDNLEWIVKDSKGNIIKDSAGTITNNEIEVTLEEVQFTNKVAMNFRALREGTYTLIPKVGEKEGQGVEITIDAKNPIVTRIELGAIENEDKFRIGQTRDVIVDFVHEYEANVERTIEVEANRITIEINGKIAVEGTDYNLIDDTGRIINLSTSPSTYVEKIRLIGTTEGQKTVNVYVDKGQSGKEAKATKVTTVLVKAKVFIKLAQENKSIKLYTTMPAVIGENEILELGDNGTVYTLVRAWLEDEDGNITKLKASDISNLKTDTNKVLLIDSKYDAGTLPMSLVTHKLFVGTKENIEPAEPTEGADYIGITIVNNGASLLRNERVILRYGASTEEINIEIPRSEISTIKVTNGTTRGYCTQPIQVGTVKSGTNEIPITPDNLEWEVQDAKGNVIKNSAGTITSNIVNIQLSEAQMTETVAIEFTAQEKGTYKIIAKIGSISADAIEVTIDENPIVTRINLGDIDGKLTVGKRKEVNVQFFHSYAENDERQIEVEANRITVEINGVVAVVGTDYELMQYDEVNKVNKIINVANDPTATVEKIQLVGTTAGEKVVNVYVDKNTENEEMATKTITVAEPVEPTLTTDAETIKFYTTMPDEGTLGENEKVELGQDGTTPYTLIKVWLDADGETTNITRADITNSVVEVKYMFRGTMEMSFILDAYKEIDGVISRAEGSEPVTYVGVALFAGGSSVMQDGDKVLLKYNGNTVKEITVKK